MTDDEKLMLKTVRSAVICRIDKINETFPGMRVTYMGKVIPGRAPETWLERTLDEERTILSRWLAQTPDPLLTGLTPSA